MSPPLPHTPSINSLRSQGETSPSLPAGFRNYIQNQVYSIMLLVFYGILFHLSSILFYFTYWRIDSLFYSVSSIYSILFHVTVHILCISVYIHYICIWSLEIDPIPAVVRQLTPADGHQCADLSCWQLWTCHRQGRGWPGWGRHPMRFKLTSVVNTLIVKKTSFKERNVLKHLYLSSTSLFCFESWGNGNRKSLWVSLSTAIFVAHLISIAKANFVTSLPNCWSNGTKGTTSKNMQR